MRTPKTGETMQKARETGQRLKALRKSAGLSLQDIAERLNREYGATTNKGMISKYENGVHEPSAGTLFCLSRILGVSVDYLMGRTENKHDDSPASGSGGGCAVPVFLRYNPVDGGELDCEATELIPRAWLIGGRSFFGLRIRSGRLAPRYYDGDVVIFERRGRTAQEYVTLVSVADEDAILCHVIKKREGKIIQPLDPRLSEVYYTTEELASVPVRILGVAVQVRRMEYSLPD